jgi:glycosyltransferase involved in cell wall biosynthesis
MSVPVVTTSSCGIPDVVRDGREGTLVPAGDVDALARALTGLLRDPDRAATMAAAAARRVRSEFTWARVVDRMAPVLDGALLR